MPDLFMKYFVLKPRGDDAYALASRTAMHRYAKAIEPTDPGLSKALREWAIKEGIDTHLGPETSDG